MEEKIVKAAKVSPTLLSWALKKLDAGKDNCTDEEWERANQIFSIHLQEDEAVKQKRVYEAKSAQKSMIQAQKKSESDLKESEQRMSIEQQKFAAELSVTQKNQKRETVKVALDAGLKVVKFITLGGAFLFCICVSSNTPITGLTKDTAGAVLKEIFGPSKQL